ncbi:nucleotidyltransferase family protein [Candidatus Methylomirabilis sp.]|uniref:Nucleotidyltransferase family protein n=1 Tax=Candidatus Methylomirabilis tolerans TaxID=3123416 RepID=A0AAJ1AJ92_9BACT|nr:nucleotidyltransferase family protein [Candidatus Methylomirabilis sp.]
MKNIPPLTAIVLAADRIPDDPVARAAGVSCKALVPVGGIPMVLRVLGALAEAEGIGDRVLCGPAWHAVETHEELHRLSVSGQIKWVEARETPSSSVLAVMQSLSQEDPVLLVTADHALLNAQLVDYFCSEARMRGADVVVGLAAYDIVAAAYPQMRRTVLRFRDGGVCGCNLYAFLTAKGRSLIGFWGQVEALRKKPVRLISKLGWVSALGFFFGWLSLHQAIAQLSRRLNLSIDVVMLPFPEAALDVDTVRDWELAQRIAERNRF